MAFQTGTSAASAARQDILTSLVAFATSKHISAAAVNAGGTGYTVGDILTVPHAGGYLLATLEVLTVSSGVITSVAIRNAGAYSSRVATIAVNAGGSGYTTNDVFRLTTGTATEFCKGRVTSHSSGVVTGVAIYETGGAYSADPTLTAGATNSDIGTGTGTGLTVDVTMTGLIGTTGVAVTGGTGSGATFDLTLTDTGMSVSTAAQNRNDYSFNSITTEKEVILQGTVAGGDEPYIGIRTYTATSGINTRHGWLIAGMDSFNPSLAFSAQANIQPAVDPATNGGVCLLMFDNAQSWWFSVNGRRLIVVIKAVGGATTAYMSAFAGLLDPLGTQTENPYPMYLSGSAVAHNRAPDAGGFLVTGLTEAFYETTTSPCLFRRGSDGVWVRCVNSVNGTASNINGVYPVGAPNPASNVATNEHDLSRNGQFGFSADVGQISLANGGIATQVLMPPVGSTDEIALVPVEIFGTTLTSDNDTETQIRGEMPNVFWTSATKSDGSAVVAEDIFEIGSDRYIVFQNAARTERYSYFALKAS